MNFDDFLKSLANYQPPEFKQEPTISMTFAQFLEDDKRVGRHNLYIIWRGKQALYVGIARDHIWGRWFARGGQSHMYFSQKYSGTREGGTWRGFTPIGIVIQRNFPKSLKWKVEQRHYNTFSWCTEERLETAERRLIQELRPLFNTTYRPSFTHKENELIRKLEHVNF